MLANRQRNLANKAYPNAYAIDVPAEPFRTYAKRKDFIAAYQEAVDSAERKGESLLPPLSELENADFVSTELLHKIKIGLDKVIAAEKDAFGRLSKKGAELNQVKKEFNNKLKELNPEYAASNAKFADEARIQEAFDLGSTYNKFDADELAFKIKNLNKDEKEAFRVGLLSNAKKQLSEFKGGNFINKIFSSDKQKAAMRTVFDTPKDYQDFVKQLQYSADKLKTTQKVLGALKKNDLLIFDNVNMSLVDGSTRTSAPIIYKITD
jgi:Asp-tRNA(Asn)/Glu-tRNA(Gln) amidotransferase A subunit family amidase